MPSWRCSGHPSPTRTTPSVPVRAALRMQQTLAEHTGRLSSRVQMRIGVNTGEVLVGPLRSGGDYTALGDAVNIAQRLQVAAPPGGVLVGPATHAATESVIQYEPMGGLHARGREELVDAWLAVEPVVPSRHAAAPAAGPARGPRRRAPAAPRRTEAGRHPPPRLPRPDRGRRRGGQEPPRRGADRRGQGGLRRHRAREPVPALRRVRRVGSDRPDHPHPRRHRPAGAARRGAGARDAVGRVGAGRRTRDARGAARHRRRPPAARQPTPTSTPSIRPTPAARWSARCWPSSKGSSARLR